MLAGAASELRKQQNIRGGNSLGLSQIKAFGFKFRRKHPFSNYILDFYCHALKLVTEVDGPIHDVQETKKNDEIRQHREESNLAVLRYRNDNVRLKPEEIIRSIETFLRRHKTKPK